MVKVGEPAPEFCLTDQEGDEFCLKDGAGQWLVLYFYPKDGTQGCTMEALDFTANIDAFASLGAKVFGISPDPSKSHLKFIDKNDLRLTLLSDEGHGVLSNYGVWQKKKMYGKEYEGVVRSTFIIGPDGRVRWKWEKVKVSGHVGEVLGKLKELMGA
ncbi:MAG: peroxiredoxin [Candidatus Methanofastidiosa archaeon]|nr:peroxiredoxin [Candidatus Methanofastidiosa archaeon]